MAKILNKELVIIFIDIEKAFDSVSQFDIFELLLRRDINIDIVKLLLKIYEHEDTELIMGGIKMGNIQTKKGVRQGAATSPSLFNLVMDELIGLII